MKTLTAAVIGSGFIGPAHIEALRRIPGVRIAALASKERDRAEEIASNFGIHRVYDNWEDAIRDPEIEVVHNCTPNALHFEINKAVVKAGKHIISEKPLTLTGDESAELLTLVKKHGVVNAVNFNYRSYPLIQQARGMVKSGEVGEIFLVHGHYLQDWLYYDTDYNWRIEPRASGASRAIADIGSHWCDLVQFVTGQKIVKVCATLVTVHPKRKKAAAQVDTFKGKEKRIEGTATTVTIETEDAGIIMFELQKGARGTVTVSQVSAGRKNCEWFEVDGSKLALAWNQEEPNQLWIGHRDRANETLIKDPSLLSPEARAYAHYPGGHPEGFPDGLKNMFMNVYDFIRSGRDPRSDLPNFPTFADGHVENRVVEAVLKSNRKKQWVTVQK
jgi:predicted dehydrogenase